MAAQASWLLQRLLRTAAQRLRDGACQVPAAAWRRWGLVLLVGFICCFLFTWGLTRFFQWAVTEGGMQAYDERFAHWFADNSMTFSTASLISSAGSILYAGLLLLITGLLALQRQQALAAASMLAAYVLARPLILYGWWLWDRARPDFVAGGIAALPTHSFPSGHAALALTLYGFLGYLWVRASGSRIEQLLVIMLAAAWVLAISMSRIRLGVHWPSDVVGGLIVGSVWLGIVIGAHISASRLIQTGSGAHSPASGRDGG